MSIARPRNIAADRDRSRAYWDAMRAREQCTTPGCRKKSTEINPRTGRTFWQCRDCRLGIPPRKGDARS